MAEWTVTQSGEMTTPSDDTTSPWYDGGAQTALARYPLPGEQITHDGTYILTPGTLADFIAILMGERVVLDYTASQSTRMGPTP